uniref:Uncharacterized protein n=1 Tax=Cacopsylla melanoneura TaxID=428564 RepID=A0A8D8S4C3_9HEMI
MMQLSVVTSSKLSISPSFFISFRLVFTRSESVSSFCLLSSSKKSKFVFTGSRHLPSSSFFTSSKLLFNSPKLSSSSFFLTLLSIGFGTILEYSGLAHSCNFFTLFIFSSFK